MQYMTTNIFSKNWENLKWSDWMPLDASHEVFKQITTELGVYRVRADDTLDYQLLELEVDLVGCYFSIYEKAPVFQYGG